MGATKTAAVVVFLGLSGIILWQYVQLRQLTAESNGLRQRLAQAATVQEQHGRMDTVPPSEGQRSDQQPSSELLRLRGEVTVLRRQLADTAKPNSTPTGAPKAGPSEPLTQPRAQAKSSLAAMDAHLATQEQKLEVARQKVAGLLATLSIPQDVSKLEAATVLGREDLKQYWSYFKAKDGLEEEERYTQILKLKVRFEHLNAGDYTGASPSP